MRRFFKTIKATPILLALIFIALFFFPAAIIAPAESVSNAIVTAIGLDKQENEYEVTLLTFLSYPNQSYTERYEIFTSTGGTLSEALTKAGLQLGKAVSLFHTHTAVVSENLLKEDIAPALNYLVRVASLPQSCILIGTNVETKLFMEFVKELDAEADLNLEELTFFNSNYVYWNDTSINSFLQGYYSPTETSLISYMPLVESTDDGIPIDKPLQTEEGEQGSANMESGGSGAQTGGTGSGSSGSSSGGSQSSGQQGGQYELINDGNEIIIKKGKKVADIDRDILRGLNWFSSRTTGAVLILDDVNDENFDHAQLAYKVNQKQIRQHFDYENGVPVCTTSIRLFVNLTEVDASKEELKKKNEASYISDAVRDKIEETVKSQISGAVDVFVQNKTDVLEMYEHFYRAQRGQTKKFLKQVGSPDEFLSHVVFKVVVSVFPN